MCAQVHTCVSVSSIFSFFFQEVIHSFISHLEYYAVWLVVVLFSLPKRFFPIVPTIKVNLQEKRHRENHLADLFLFLSCSCFVITTAQSKAAPQNSSLGSQAGMARPHVLVLWESEKGQRENTQKVSQLSQYINNLECKGVFKERVPRVWQS